MAESAKQALLKAVEQMPDDVSAEDIMYTLYVRYRIELGLREIDEGKTVPHEEVMQELKQWLQSVGQRELDEKRVRS